MEPTLDHERLEVYHLCRKLNRQIAELIPQLRPNPMLGLADSVDNLRRAVKSMSRSLAEGAGRWHKADKIYRYLIARGSGTEAGASLDELVDFGMATEEMIRPAKRTVVRIVAMIISMIRATEARPDDPPGAATPRTPAMAPDTAEDVVDVDQADSQP